jgi:hypothetical protein
MHEGRPTADKFHATWAGLGRGIARLPVNFPTLLRQPAGNLTEVSRSAIRESSAAQPS